MASPVVQIDVRSLRSAQLQIELKKRGLSSSGKKSELRRRLEEALAKEKGNVTQKAEGVTATANNNENNVSNKTTGEQSTTDKPVTVTTDNAVTTVCKDAATRSSEDKTDRVEDSVQDKNATVITTTEEPAAPAVTQTQTDLEIKVVEQMRKENKPEDKVEKEVEVVENTPTQQRSGDVTKPTTEAASSAEVSMEMDDLVVHAVDEDDFKMEEQSRDHVNKKSGELPSSTTDEQGEVDSPSVKKRKLHLQGSTGTPMSSSERKRKWKSSSSKSSATTISSDVLKKIIPDSVTKEVTGDTVDDVFPDSSTASSHDSTAKPEEETKPVTMTTGSEVDRGEQERLQLAEEETRRRIEIRLREKQDGEQRQQQPVKPSDVTESDLTPNKEVIVDYNQPVRVRSPSTNHNPPSAILHITNLVRPFALSQLKELLSEDGSLVTDGFWINKIKSHCFAVYENTDAALATRNRLDGVRWPVTNPKVIIVDFSNEEEIIAETGGILTISSGVTMEHGDMVTKHDTVKDKHVPKTEEKPKQVVKEEAMQVEESSAAPQEGGAGIQEADNKSAVNRLDELFKKTLATPQIYWLPLTTEEGEKRLAAIKADEEARRQRREQRQKDREEKERLEQEEREKRRKAREEEREKRRRQRSTSRHRSRSRSRHRSRSRSKHRSHSRSRHQR